MQDVTIVSGSYRNNPLSDIKCKLIGDIKMGAKGWYGNFIDVPGMGSVRIQLPSEASVIRHGRPSNNAHVESLSDDMISARIQDRFDILTEIVSGLASDNVRSLIISGAPGMGKSVGIQAILDKEGASNSIDYNKVSGNIVSAYQLYQTLYENQEHNQVLILDDCDSLLFDGNSVNLLKAALESGNKPRMVSYQSQSVTNLGLPTKFEFKGRVIFITNLNFQAMIDKDKTIGKHLAALVDRSLYLDLTMHTRREIWCRIKTMIERHGLFREFMFTTEMKNELLDYISERREDFRSLSLRTAVQLAQFTKTSPNGWRRMSEAFQIRPR